MEVMLGIAIFSIFLSGLGMTLIYGQENTINAGDRTRGVYLAERSMEAVRAIRDASFSSVTTGTKGLWINPATDQWAFSGSQVTVSGAYVLSVTVSSKASDWMAFTGTTTWKHGYNRAGAIRLTGEITDWKSAKSIGNWASPTLEGSYNAGATPLFNKAAVAGNTAFVTCNASNGLYMIDISNTASPSRIGSSFSIGYAATGVAVRGRRLYVLTADPNAELKVYNITTPASPTLVTSYNLPGTALGTSLAIGANMLYAGAIYNASLNHYELYGFDISNSGSLVLKSTFGDTDSVNAVALSGTSAYLATSVDAAELRILRVSSTGGLSLVGGYNVSDRTWNAMSIAVSGTSALLGTLANASNQTSILEMVMFDVGNGGGVPSGSGPWYHEGSGSLLGIDMDPYGCYAFLGASTGKKALQVVNMRNKASLPELYSYNSTLGLGRGLTYDLVRDRVYLLTDQGFLIFKPASSGGTSCP